MATESHPPVNGRRLLAVAFAAAVAGAVLIASFTYADHAPSPHGVRIAVVAPRAVAARVADGLDRAAPGGFVVIRVRSANAARIALRTQRARGAIILGPGRTAPILTAGAAGLTLQQVVATALTHVAAAAGRRPVVSDVVPLAASDRSGLGPFLLELGLLVPSVLGSVGLYLVGLRARLWWRVASAGIFALLVAAFGTLILVTGFGALGAWAATFGIAVLGALAFVLTVAAVQATFGLPGTGIAAVVLIFLGNAVSGGSVPTALLPDVDRAVSPWTPNGAIVHAVRAVLSFSGHGLGQPLAALFIWVGGALIVLVANDLLHLAERRRTPERAAEVYATSGLSHARRRLGRRGAAESRGDLALPARG